MIKPERLFEKAMQELIEPRAGLSEGRGVFFSGIPLILSRRFLLAYRVPAGMATEPTLKREFLATPAARLASPRCERQSRDAGTKFQGGQRPRRSFRARGGWSISCQDWRSASPATPEGRLFAQHRAGQRSLDAGRPAVAIGKSRE
jgi:hypothetical protein